MKTKDYFKVEVLAKVVFLLMVYFVVSFITNYRIVQDVQIYWDIVIIVTVAELGTLFVLWIVYGKK